MIRISSMNCPCNESNKIAAANPEDTSAFQINASPADICSCTPYKLLCCCGPKNGISVIQPACQNLPDGSVVNNPAYVAQLNKSFWTYKFMTDCSSTARGISSIGIPICKLIISDNLIVTEKIDGCGTFKPVPYTLTLNDPVLGPAPDGFQFVKIETSDRYDTGLTVEYRLEIVGDYPVAYQSINVKAGTNLYIFDCGCFAIPQCNPEGKLTLTKECSHIINNNRAELIYHLTVTNIGDAPLSNVQFNDIITIPANINPGTITVTPSTLTATTTPSGQIVISGNLGTLIEGGQIKIDYSLPIVGVTSPGSYIISNSASVLAAQTQASATCFTTINAVQLTTEKCCDIEEKSATYRYTISSVGQSPNILVNVIDNLIIPGGITVRFTSFGGCNATFANSTNQVPLDTNLTGPLRIQIECDSILIPSSGSSHRDILFQLVSSTFTGTVTILNEVESVTPTNPSDQIFLGAGNLPVSAAIDVSLALTCHNPCE